MSSALCASMHGSTTGDAGTAAVLRSARHPRVVFACVVVGYADYIESGLARLFDYLGRAHLELAAGREQRVYVEVDPEGLQQR